MGTSKEQQGQPERQSQLGELPTQQARPRQFHVPAPVGYLLLFVFGALQGLIGSFQYSRSPTPLIAIVLIVILFVTCLGCGWGFGTFAGGLVPAIGWVLASFIIAMPRQNGSVIITATAAGEWYLYGGAIACLAGSVGALALRFARR